jgi:hypothetical protein
VRVVAREAEGVFVLQLTVRNHKKCRLGFRKREEEEEKCWVEKRKERTMAD